VKFLGLDRLSRRGRIILGVVLGVILVAAGAALYVQGRTGNTYNPNARFVHQPAPKPPAKPVSFNWQLFGYTPEHTRFFPAPATLAPPFRIDWRYAGGGLLEFPPVVRENLLFQLVDSGELYALNKETGRLVWRRQLGRLAASTPALDDHDLYATLLEGPSGGVGRAVALEQATGRIIWSRTLNSRSESSPMVDGNDVYFGTESGTVYALEKATGRTIWTYQAAGAVKASPTLAGGDLFFGDYGGQVQAISARTGAPVWKTQSEGAALGSGTFYSTPAVIFGRVYLGNTDGHVYAYDERTGALDWAVQTGSYVYASPAVTETPGLGPTVYVGSYTGEFYALNAQSGAVRWTYAAGGKISGSATIIGHVVYFAALGTHELLGLDTRTGRRLFRFHDGAFDPGISDGQRLYLSGGYTLYSLQPRR
jgi:outer membrane protein assembly factor BamB